MGYLKEFQKEIGNRDLPKFMFLWEEYCTSDMAPVEEIKSLLELIRDSDFKPQMGKVVETIIPLINTLKDEKTIYSVLVPLYDIQTTNSQELYDMALFHVKRLYESHHNYSDILRLTSLRSKSDFQGALSAFDLLAHLGKGNFVYHHGGWGAGEVMELSFLSETVVLEFENASGRKSITLCNAMRSMTPLAKTHFLARRFGDPDTLEKEAKKDPVAVVKMVLQDLGPKNAAEIKDELAELVIPEKDWAKWWQLTRGKLKKDLSIETPATLKEPFMIREQIFSHEQEFLNQIKKKRKPEAILAACHAFSKEHPSELKNLAVKEVFLSSLNELEQAEGLPLSHKIEIALMKKSLFSELPKVDLKPLFEKSDNLVYVIDGIEILQYKKMALAWVREHIEGWAQIFAQALEVVQASLVRDYIVKELGSERDLLEKKVKALISHPNKNPDLFFWFFNKKILQKEDEALNSPEDWWEALLLLLNKVENTPGYSDLAKKIGLVITANRYKEVRDLFKDSSFEFTKEFLLLASKCHSITPHDLKSLKSLAAVRFPVLAAHSSSGELAESDGVIWASSEAYLAVKERIRHIATVETIDNAKEIEAARALGDLRENSEYKYAKERRSRLQGEMKHLSQEMGRARILTEQDVSPSEVGPGSVVEVADSKGATKKYTLMGSWDANPEKSILSLHSKFAEAMLGKGKGDTFQFKDETFTLKSLKTVFDK